MPWHQAHPDQSVGRCCLQWRYTFGQKESTMPTSSELALQQRCQQIVTSPVLSPEQKRHFLALEAENACLIRNYLHRHVRRWMMG
ncbi:hypothetical protein ACNKHK_28525 [Shigella flexneri]